MTVFYHSNNIKGRVFKSSLGQFFYFVLILTKHLNLKILKIYIFTVIYDNFHVLITY